MPQEKETARVEAFSDGVFGIAMTLLVLEFKVPHIPPEHREGNWALALELLKLWPSFLAFVLSFGTVLIMWANHHGLFKHAHRADNRLLFANGFLLLIVTFVPFPTAVLAEYLDRPGAKAAAMFYCTTYVLVAISYNAVLHAVVRSRAPAVTSDPAHNGAIRRIRRAYHAGLITYLLATLLSAFSAFAGLAICLSLWPLWALLSYSPKHQASAASSGN
jgi:uncharacterized membrane protein